MKFNFKKIASVLASTVMLSSTVAIAAATTFPAPFVTNGSPNVAIVYGAASAPTDLVAATDIQNNLNGKVTTTTSSSSSTATGGDFRALDKSNNKLNLGDSLNSVYSDLDKDQLSNILADGVYSDNDGTDHDTTQKIDLGSVKSSFFVPNDEAVSANEVPLIGFDLTSGTDILNYTLTFKDPVDNRTATADDAGLMKTTTLDMLGREYYIADVDSSTADLKLTLLDTANSAVVNEGETASVNVGSNKYDVQIVSVDGTNNKATLSVNGVKLDAIKVGSSKKIAPDTYLSVKDVYEGKRERDVSYVEFSIGNGQIILENGQNVEINEDTVDDLFSYFTFNGGKLKTIVLQWEPQDEQYLVPGNDLTLPGLENIKISNTGLVTANPEAFTVKNSGDDYEYLANVDVIDGTVSNLPLVFTNATGDGFGGTGKDDTHVLKTTTGDSIELKDAENPYFVATYEDGDNSQSYVFQLQSITKGSNDEVITKIRNLATGTDTSFTDADDNDFGDLTLATADPSWTNKNVSLTVSGPDASKVHLDRLITAKGLTIALPVQATTANTTSAELDMWEADKDGKAGELAGPAFNATIAFTGTDNKIEVENIAPDGVAPESGSDDIESYVPGDGGHATKLLLNDADQKTLDVTYHADEAYLDVIVSESGVTISNNGTTSSTIMVVKDSEVSSVSGKNLIVVGGSCVNSVAAELIGATYPACGSDWQTATGVGAGSYLIQTFSRSTGTVATLVAGYNAPDTTNAANALIVNANVDTTAGKKYTGSVGTTISLVTS